MKKKFREITVCETTFGWTLNPAKGCCSKEHTIKIWLNKKVIHTEGVRCAVTPSIVKDIIFENKLWEN